MAPAGLMGGLGGLGAFNKPATSQFSALGSFPAMSQAGIRPTLPGFNPLGTAASTAGSMSFPQAAVRPPGVSLGGFGATPTSVAPLGVPGVSLGSALGKPATSIAGFGAFPATTQPAAVPATPGFSAPSAFGFGKK